MVDFLGGSNFLGGSFSNRDNVLKVKRWLKNDFSSRTDPSVFTSIAPVLLDRSNGTSWVFPVLKSKSHFLPQSTVSDRSDSSSEANSREIAQIAILQMTWSGKSLMDIRKSVGPRMGPWRTPAFARYSYEDFPSRTTRSCLLLGKEEIRSNIWP